MPTVARGVAAAALLASAWIGWLAVQRLGPVAPEPLPAWCDTPIEINTADGRGRLACADAVASTPCGPLQAGDRVELIGDRCAVDAQGMRPGWRLLRGLPIDLHRAHAADLALIDGIGPKTAARIVAYRHQVGRVCDLDQLRQVPGVGPKTVAKLKGLLRAEPEGCAALPRQSIGQGCNVDG